MEAVVHHIAPEDISQRTSFPVFRVKHRIWASGRVASGWNTNQRDILAGILPAVLLELCSHLRDPDPLHVASSLRGSTRLCGVFQLARKTWRRCSAPRASSIAFLPAVLFLICNSHSFFSECLFLYLLAFVCFNPLKILGRVLRGFLLLNYLVFLSSFFPLVDFRFYL